MRLLRNVRFDDLVSDVATAATKVASGPDMTPPKALPQMRKLREEAIGAFPFIRWIKRLMVTCGGIATMTWTWSAEICPLRMSTLAFWHSSRTMERTRSALTAQHLMTILGDQTIWRWMENVVWEPWR